MRMFKKKKKGGGGGGGGGKEEKNHSNGHTNMVGLTFSKLCVIIS